MKNGIKEIAKALSVSPATVSRALNNERYVRQDLRERILRTAEEMGYEPNYMAKSLLRNKTYIIGVAVSDIATSFFSTMLRNIERYASRCGYTILLCNIDNDLAKEKKGLSLFRQMCVDGIVLTHEQMDNQIRAQLKAMAGMPMVACSCRLLGFDFTSVNIDDKAAAHDAIMYLYENGHRRIAYLGGSLDEYTTGALRFEGVKKAFEKLGIPERDRYIDFGALGIEEGYRMAEKMLATRESALPTAIFAGSDDVAVGAKNCLADHGVRIPQDISIIGFDNSEISRNVRPMLTTVHQPIDEIGTATIKALIELIENRDTPVRDILLPHKIVVRDSCLPRSV